MDIYIYILHHTDFGKKGGEKPHLSIHLLGLHRVRQPSMEDLRVLHSFASDICICLRYSLTCDEIIIKPSQCNLPNAAATIQRNIRNCEMKLLSPESTHPHLEEVVKPHQLPYVAWRLDCCRVTRTPPAPWHQGTSTSTAQRPHGPSHVKDLPCTANPCWQGVI